jgi:hypothetical protein
VTDLLLLDRRTLARGLFGRHGRHQGVAGRAAVIGSMRACGSPPSKPAAIT